MLIAGIELYKTRLSMREDMEICTGFLIIWKDIPSFNCVIAESN